MMNRMKQTSMQQLALVWFGSLVTTSSLSLLVSAFGLAPLPVSVRPMRQKHATTEPLWSSTAPFETTKETPVVYSPVFDFGLNDTVSAFDRINDSIMGGVSSSTLIDVPGEDYAKWLGICRTTGGGFCGTRTLPFTAPLNVTESTQGFYIICRLASDDEADRRAWKISTRIRPDRGEELYQARFYLDSSTMFRSKDDESSWCTVLVPFEDFRLVRGARAVPDSPPLNTTGGIFQIGLVMSKFGIPSNETMVEVPNFREGPFELHLKEIGFYQLLDKEKSESSITTISVPKVLSKAEAAKQAPVILKILRPVSKIFFTEQSQRRKVAMKLLTSKRNLSRLQAIWFGVKSRAASKGWIVSVGKLFAILSADIMRSLGLFALRLSLLYPIRLLRLMVKGLVSLGKPQKKPTSA
jgi:hypothetical protein